MQAGCPSGPRPFICYKKIAMTLRRLVFLLAMGFMLVASPAQAAPWEDFNGNFETGDFSQYLEVQAIPERATIVKSPDPVGEGTYAARFERREGDELKAGSNRSEIVPAREFHAGETLYFRHLLYLPYASIDWKHFLILCQWHDSSPGSPPLSLQTFEEGGVKKLRIGSGDQSSIYYEFNVPGNAQWFELVYRISFGINGSIEVWLNGKSLGEVDGINTLGTEPTNWKLGNYRSSEAEGTTVVYQDGVTITKKFFSDPPKEPVKEVEKPTVAPVLGPPVPASPGRPEAPDTGPNTRSCQLARGELRRAQARLKVAQRRFSDTWPPAKGRRWRKQVKRDAKRYRQAKQSMLRACR